jgi:hypothetical protein
MTRRENYADRKRRGQCVDCRAGLQLGDGVRCIECTEAHRKRRRAYGRTARGRAVNAAHLARLRTRRKAAGICADCTAPARPGHVACEACAHLRKLSHTDYLDRKEATPC